jgi:phosphoribosyl 1,2-cyclic phosphodiesterase
MRARFWGVRGSIASPGPKTLRYGGNTSCVAVESEAGDLIVLDAGSGFCPLGDALMHGPFGKGEGRMTLLLSHTHMDHLIGFPFAIPVHIPGNHFAIYGPATSRRGLEELHEGLVAPAYSPVYKLENIGAELEFHHITSKPFDVGCVRVQAQRFPHGMSSFSWGLKLTEGQRVLVYIPDVEYRRGDIPDEAVEFVRGVDLLIHDAYFTYEDYIPGWGNSRSHQAVMLAEAARVKRLILFHHSPDRSDADIDALVADHRDALQERGVQLRVDAAYEGLVIQL